MAVHAFSSDPDKSDMEQDPESGPATQTTGQDPDPESGPATQPATPSMVTGSSRFNSDPSSMTHSSSSLDPSMTHRSSSLDPSMTHRSSSLDPLGIQDLYKTSGTQPGGGAWPPLRSSGVGEVGYSQQPLRNSGQGEEGHGEQSHNGSSRELKGSPPPLPLPPPPAGWLPSRAGKEGHGQ